MRFRAWVQIALLVSLASTAFTQAYAVDGLAISNAYRWAKDYSAFPELSLWRFGDNSRYTGKIIAVRIENNAPVRCDTIYKATWARYPVFNLDGTKIAFLRLSARNEGAQLVEGNGPCYISIMGTDGSNVQDLISMAFGGGRTSIDWPYGDWVYYQKMDTWEIWRVNVVSKTNELVSNKYRDFRKWDVSMDATRAAIQTSYPDATAPCCGTYSTPHLFPPSQHPTNQPDRCAPSGCNVCISPSGKYLAHFVDGPHKCINLKYWSWQDDCVELLPWLSDPSQGYWSNSIVCNATMAEWGNFDLSTVCGDDAGMDWPRWPVNSDKWVCCNIGCGRAGPPGNQVLVNFVDSIAVKVTNNQPSWPDGAPAHKYGNTAGDFFVQGGPSGHYEDIDGNWVDAGSGQVVRARRASHGIHAQFGVVLQGKGTSLTAKLVGYDGERATLYNAEGQVLARYAIAADCVELPLGTVPCGVSILRVHSANGATLAACRVVR